MEFVWQLVSENCASQIKIWGTGTTDIIELCEKSGLRTPEFHQDEDFLIRIWRPENAGATLSTDHQTAHETDHQTAHEIDLVQGHEIGHETGHETDHEIGHESEQVMRLISVLRDGVKTREKIMLLLNLKGRDNFRANYLIPAINAGLVAMLYTDNPRRKGQAYYLTQKGLDVLKTE